jgi:hypothetical protein
MQLTFFNLQADPAAAVAGLQVRVKQYQRDELLQQLLAVTDSSSCQQGRQHDSSALQQLLLTASIAALQKSIARVSGQIEAADVECLAAEQEYACAAEKAAGVRLRSEKMTVLLQMTVLLVIYKQQLCSRAAD